MNTREIANQKMQSARR